MSGQDVVPHYEDGARHVTRFAPSPTGYLHLGHAYAALFAYEVARQTGGHFLLRLEDIDYQRCRPEFEQAIIEDLGWLGFTWDGEPVRQSQRTHLYEAALSHLRSLDVVYPCFCSRKRIRMEVEEAGRAPHAHPGELIYPGICRSLDPQESVYRQDRGEPFAWRLDVERAIRLTGPLWWFDVRAGWTSADVKVLGDVVIARKDAPTSYHLAVVVDDATQGVTLVTRGEDLFHATHVHRLLQALLELPTPHYYHHNLIADRSGQRLAKRNRAVTLRHLRDLRKSPDEVWRLIGLHPVQELEASA